MITKDSFHSSIAAEIIDYISLKQALGRSFQSASISSCLPGPVLVRVLERHLPISPWRPSDCGARRWNRFPPTPSLLACISSGTSASTVDAGLQPALFRIQANSRKPAQGQGRDIFSDIEVARLLHHSNSIPVLARSPLRAATTRLAIVLLYTTGIRRGELLRLTRADYNPLGANAHDSFLQVLQVAHPAFAERRGDGSRSVLEEAQIRSPPAA